MKINKKELINEIKKSNLNEDSKAELIFLLDKSNDDTDSIIRLFLKALNLAHLVIDYINIEDS